MTIEERVERLRNEKIAVHCKTKEEAAEFVRWCLANGFEGEPFIKDITHFDDYKDKTCYSRHSNNTIFLAYAPKHHYEEKGYEVITYKDFMKEENKMTNLEYVASKGLIGICDQLCAVAHVCKYGSSCLGKDCFKCEFDDNINLCVRTLLKEYEEPIKILDEVEKRYLEGVLRPFKDEVDYIEKQSSSGTEEEFIHFYIRNDYNFIFPNFKKGTMYKGMECLKKYTIEELGLFRDWSDEE